MKKSKKKMLVTGVSGQLGSNLAWYFRKQYDVLGLYNAHSVKIEGVHTGHADILDAAPLKKIVRDFRPDILIHCASLTNIDFCESNRALADLVNVRGTKAVVESVPAADGCKIIYISSDSVYDGRRGGFTEEDFAEPPNYYGLTKYQGEQEVLKRENSLVLRTNIFGWNIRNKYSIAEWILHELMEQREIVGFQDVCFSSIYNLNFAGLLEQIMEREISGVYNCASGTSCSKFEFALQVADCFSLDKKLIKPISIDDYPLIAKRGKNLTLNVEKLAAALGSSMPSIEKSVEDFYHDFQQGFLEKIRTKKHAYPLHQSILPYGRQFIDDDDIQAVVEVLKSPNLTQGPTIPAFESELRAHVDVQFAVACNSGTSGLHMACMAAGVGPGDEVITSPNTFVASANCVLYCGAKPVFADIDPRTYNIAPAEIAGKITMNTKAVIPVHFAGQSCDMEAIRDVVRCAEKKYGHKIYIIEDACHALGAFYKTTKVGSCVFSDMTVMSFHPVKHITTGEGGIVFTNDEALSKQLKRLRSHGITSDPAEFRNIDLAFQPSAFSLQPSVNPWYYEQISLGYNYRITDIQCALGLSQLKKLDQFRRRRREIVNIYNASFSQMKDIQTPWEDANCDSNFHLYVLLFDFEKIGTSRTKLVLDLRKNGIITQVHYIPVYLQYYYQRSLGTSRGDCPNAEVYYQKCLSLPLHPAMVDQDINRVIREIKKAIKGK